MTVRKQPNGKWLCECYPNGRNGKRVRKQFATKGEAIAFESFTMEEVNKKPWLGEKEDRRHLSELIEQWYSLYGQTLADPKRLMAKLRIICNGLGDPIASELTAGDFTKYREARLKGEVRNEDGTLMSPVKPRTVNLEQRNLSSVFGTLKKLGHWSAPNPLAGLPTFKITEGELAFLSVDEIKRLLAACAESQSPSLLMIAKICLATGARWSEAENLQGHQISKYRITYTKTKGKKTEQYQYLKICITNSPKTEGSYSRHAENLLSVQ
nr:Integrase [Salmonella enterica subsp. enterica serovar Enteritidis str. 642044 8-1]